MRIDALHLLAYGPFTDRLLDLSKGQEGLHVVFGRNEAGKSTALRALVQFFYGIDERSTDRFVHPYEKLRIGATIRPRRGEPLHAVRRKGNKNTLRDGDDREAIDEEQLARMLGGIDRAAFTTMFGFSHEGLRHGGEEIVEGGGDVGQVLFSAAAGISSLKAIDQRLEKAGEEIFKPSGQKPRLNKQLSALGDANKAFREAQLPAKEWVRCDRELNSASTRLEEIDTELGRLRAGERRVQRLLQALKYIPQHRQVLEQQAELGTVIVLPERFTERRFDAEKLLDRAVREQESACKELDRLEGELAGVAVPEGVIESDPLIGELLRGWKQYGQARIDLPKREAERDAHLAQARSALAGFRPGVSLEVADTLRLSDAQEEAIRGLALEHQAALRAPQQAEHDWREAEAQLAEAREELARLAVEETDAGPLRDLLRRHLEYGDLERELAELQAQEAAQVEQARSDLARLGLGGVDLDEFERRSVPDGQSVDLFQEQWDEAKNRREQGRRELRQREEERQAIDRELGELQLQGEVPTVDDVHEARRQRDQGWELVLAAWKEGTVLPERLESFLAEAGVSRDLDLAEAYRRAVERADGVADSLFREAERVHQQASLLAKRSAVEAELERLADDARQADSERAAMEERWRELWASAGVTPRTPREMRGWLDRHRQLVEQLAALRSTRAKAVHLTRRIETAREETLAQLGNYSEAIPADATLVALRQRCQRLSERLDKALVRREEMQKTIDNLARNVRQAKAKVEQARSEWQAWRERWAECVEPLGLPGDASPTAANQALATLNRVFSLLENAGDKAVRIGEMTDTCQAFERDLRLLVERLAPALGGLPPEEQVNRLSGLLIEAKKQHDRRMQLLKQRDRQQKQLQDAEHQAENARAELAALCREAECSQPEELREAEWRSNRARDLQRERRRLEESLYDVAAGMPLEELVGEACRCDANALQAELDQAARRIEEFEEERAQLHETRGNLKNELTHLETGTPAADAAEQAGSILAEIERSAWEYARLRLASAVLRRGIERYRQQNQNPILLRAGELFARLTAGAFRGLRTEDDDGKVALAGERGNGSVVASAGMSEGTRYQLYLALRIASLEHYLEHREPVPLVVDDILISFDNERSAAALEVLAELSHKTQVIFFTHHRHLLEIARQRLTPDDLFCHDLA